MPHLNAQHAYHPHSAKCRVVSLRVLSLFSFSCCSSFCCIFLGALCVDNTLVSCTDVKVDFRLAYRVLNTERWLRWRSYWDVTWSESLVFSTYCNFRNILFTKIIFFGTAESTNKLHSSILPRLWSIKGRFVGSCPRGVARFPLCTERDPCRHRRPSLPAAEGGLPRV